MAEYKWARVGSTYYGRGKKAYKHGDVIPDDVLVQMGEQTRKEYLEKGYLARAEMPKETEEDKLKRLRVEAKDMGIKGYHNMGVEKLEQRISSAKEGKEE